MTLLRLVFISFFSVAAVITNGQDTHPLKTLAVYDPLFWKDELKLDAYQTNRIKEINLEYNERLRTALQEERNGRRSLQLTLAQNLLNRSQSIWETFHPKQKKKWRKMCKTTFSSV